MRGIEPLVILPVAALYLAVVPGRKGPDDFVTDAVGLQMLLEKRGSFLVARKAVGEFRPVISLDTFDCAGKGFYQMFHKLGGGIGIVFLKRFNKTPSGILIDRCVLKELFSDHLAVF